MSFNEPLLGEYYIEKETSKLPLQFENYITTVENCEGFGNQMWRFAGLYALGKHLHRNPYYDHTEECLKEYEKEFATVFPELYKRLHFYTPKAEDKSIVDFAIPCCSFDDPNILLNNTAKALVIKGRYLQAHKFFQPIVPEIRNLFSINPSLRAAVDSYKKEDENHKICIHTRQGDFVALGTHSKLNYTEFALNHVFDLQSKRYSSASIILLGEEKSFLEKIRYDKKKIKHVYIPRELSRGEDFSFAVSSSFIMIYLYSNEVNAKISRARRFSGGYQSVAINPREFNHPHDHGPTEGKGFSDKSGKMVGLGKNFSRP
uniref:Uncharacterized protein n=1 Tax=Ditylenchus dipsaci TaxID=166011 RepID=A0A915CZR6_9BILA